MENLQFGSYWVKSDEDRSYRHGEIFHISYNTSGGSLSQPVARFHTWRPQIPVEGLNPHWRLDCYVYDNRFVRSPEQLAKDLTAILIERGVISEPLWISWHASNELDGEPRGTIYNDD